MSDTKRFRASGISIPSLKIPDVPDAPTIGTATDIGTGRAFNNGAATIAYTPVATGGTPVSFTATSSPGGFTATGTSPITVTGLQSGTAYTFTVAATNTTATSPASSSSSSITATTIPATPSAPTATDSGSGRAYNNGAASVSFTAPATGGKTISSYTVTSTPGSLTATGSSSPLTVTGLSSATAYTYTVTATNVNGTSSASSASSSVTATTVPQTPTIGTFTDGGTGTTGTLSFTAGATGGSSITNYKVSTDNVTFTALSPAQTSSPLSLSGLSVGTATYYIKAVNANGDSSASSGVSGTVLTPSSFESIATLTGSGASTVTFSSIPQTYKSLQIRFIAKSGLASNNDLLLVQFNGVTGASYSYHNIVGQGDGGVAADGINGNTNIRLGFISGTSQTPFGVGIIDIIDYASTTKNKTARSISGLDTNSTTSNSRLYLMSGAIFSTTAITSITLFVGGNYQSGTQFALYGVK